MPAETQNPKISVIIPAYNCERYIKQCVESALNQTLAEIEVIAVDDGSTDATRETLREMSRNDGRVTVLCQSNQGAGSARRAGLAAARGETVMFLDADDYYRADTLKTVYDALIAQNCEIVIFNGRSFIDEPGKPFLWYDDVYFPLDEKDQGRVKSGLDFITQTEGKIQQPCMKICRRDYLQKNGITFCEGGAGEDVYFFYRLMIPAQRVTYLHHFGFFRRYHSNTVTTAATIFHVQSRIRTFAGLYALLDGIADKRFYAVVNKQFLNYGCLLWVLLMNRNKSDRLILTRDFIQADMAALLWKNKRGFVLFVFAAIIALPKPFFPLQFIFAKLLKRLLKNKARLINAAQLIAKRP